MVTEREWLRYYATPSSICEQGADPEQCPSERESAYGFVITSERERDKYYNADGSDSALGKAANAKVQPILDEMRKLDVIGNLRQLGDDLKKENGLSIAQCEYWSDTLDRWADDLIDPVSGGT